MTLFQAIQAGFRGYVDFRGRSSRSEFWWWVLFTFLVAVIVSALPVPSLQFPDGTRTFAPALTPVWQFAVLLPSLAVLIRRLRDAGYTWGRAFWVLLPVAGLVVLAVLAAQPPRPAGALHWHVEPAVPGAQ